MDTKTYTAPAVITCTDAVQNTKSIGDAFGDGGQQQVDAPGSVGFFL